MTYDRRAWSPNSELVREVQDQFDRTIEAYRAHPSLISEHANHEESIRTGGYANRTLLELIQNAADALAGTHDDDFTGAGRVEIVLDTRTSTLYCANAGRPFSKSGLTAVTMAHLSEKRGDEIGRFGLGFKSVLAVSQSPQVFSRSISFAFNSSAAQIELAKFSSAKRHPVLRTATLLEADAEFAEDPVLTELASWATTIVKLPNAMSLERLQGEIQDFSSEFLLFVEAVREVRLRVLGDDPFETIHISRDLGGGRLVIESPGGEVSEWITANTMHEPTPQARREVGEAVSRDKVKVTVAVPVQFSNLRVGHFWSYFPLQDRTSANALFNAPWAINDDRTNLLDNTYNREILRTLAGLFVPLPTLVRGDDPGAHLDYLPARGRGHESHGFADALVGAHVLAQAVAIDYIPDATGSLRNGSDLRPLDLGVSFKAAIHAGWSNSPHTGDDAPHWRCYTNPTRIARIRELLIAAQNPDLDLGTRDTKVALEQMPKRGLLSWLREWAEGPDTQSAANAFRTVLLHSSLAGISDAKVIPTSDGLKSLKDRDVVFLQQEEDLTVDGAAFVDPAFLAEPQIQQKLRDHGFRNLDPEAILRARIARLPAVPSDDDLERLWDAVLYVSVPAASKMMLKSTASIKVPTRDGGWAWPQQVLDLDAELPESFAPRLLDRQRCLPDVARQLGAVSTPVSDYALEDESRSGQYIEATLARLNSGLGPGERTIDNADLSPGRGRGPFSVLLMLEEAGAPPAVRADWTERLLSSPNTAWVLEDLDTGRTHSVQPPALWAAHQAGLVKSSRGLRAPADVVAPSLVRFGGLLPLYKGPRQAQDALNLPDTLESVPPKVLREMLETDIFPQVPDDVLAEFVLEASRIGLKGELPTTIPARVSRTIESHPPSMVYLATSDDEEEVLKNRQRPFLRVGVDLVDEFLTFAGCRRFADSFSFAMVVEGQRHSQRILDVYTGLRKSFGRMLGSSSISRALLIAKRVITEEGTEDQPRDWHIDGQDLIVWDGANERRVLEYVNEAFDLRMDNAQISEVLQAGLAQQLELQRQQGRATPNDAERLDLYIGPDDLKEALPTGLWSALEVQGLVDDNTSVAELFLTVYGADSLRMLESAFRLVGYSDVPERWAGLPAAISWVRKMGFGAEFAGTRNESRPEAFVVPGAINLNKLHTYQKKISEDLRTVLTQPGNEGPGQKAMVELPTGAGKTRVATETILRLFVDEVLSGTILWIAQSAELCEQAVQTFQTVWRHLGDERPLTIGRLWDTNRVNLPDTDLSVVVATDAKIRAVKDLPEYEWLKTPTAVFIDEAHRAGGSTQYTAILRWLGVDGRNWERPLVGLSATPFKGRADNHSGTKELVTRFGSNKLRIPDEEPYAFLVKLGVLANVKHEVLPSGIDVNLDPAERKSLESNRLIDRNVYEKIGRNEQRMQVLVNHILGVLEEHPDWPILVFTPSVLSAQVLAASLRYQGKKAASVSGQTGRQERRNVIKQFQNGDIQVLANCDLLVQGFDAPGVRALYIARPTFSPGAYIQMAGRGLRGKENGGKEECLIVDVADNWGAMNDFLGYRDYEELWTEQQA